MRFAYPSDGEQNAAILFIQSLIKQILTFEMLPVRRRLKKPPDGACDSSNGFFRHRTGKQNLYTQIRKYSPNPYQIRF